MNEIDRIGRSSKGVKETVLEEPGSSCNDKSCPETRNQGHRAWKLRGLIKENEGAPDENETQKFLKTIPLNCQAKSSDREFKDPKWKKKEAHAG